MYALVLIVKIAAIASVVILAAAAIFAGRRGRAQTEAEAAAPVGPKRDEVGAWVMRGFTAMFLVGVAAMFAISVMDVVSHL